jgi:predicted NACHT family NTPase
MVNSIHLVSFADGAFKNRKTSFIQEAEGFGLFDSVTVYDSQSIEKKYWEQHAPFINSNKRGFGYWIWKPQVVLQRSSELADNDIIVYMDVGFELNRNGLDRFKDYIDLTLSHPTKMLSFSNTHTEQRWNKRDLSAYLNIPADDGKLKTTQLAAGLFVFQNTENNRELIERWRDISVLDNYHFSDDSDSILTNHSTFIEHRHDASIFSLLRKLRGTEVTHYEVQAYGHFNNIKECLPAWASRKGREK